jgi:hypothetical protein
MNVAKTLNENLGVLITLAIISLVTHSIVSFATDARVDERLDTAEAFMLQQHQINAASIKISENMAVLAERQTWMQKEIDRIAAGKR